MDLRGRFISRNHGNGIGIHQTLDNGVRQSYACLLKNTGHGDAAHIGENGSVKRLCGTFCADCSCPFDENQDSQQRSHQLGECRRPSCANDAPAQPRNREQIQKNIQDRRKQKEKQRPSGIPQPREHRIGGIVYQHRDQTGGVDGQIRSSAAVHLSACVQPAKERPAQPRSKSSKHKAETGHGDQRRVDRGFQFPHTFGPKELGSNYADPHGGSGCHRQEKQGDGIGRADSSKPGRAGVLSDYHTVCDVIKLLQSRAKQQGHRKAPQKRPWPSFGEIVHLSVLSSRSACSQAGSCLPAWSICVSPVRRI